MADLLVGNFGDSHVSGFVLATQAFMGQLRDTGGNVLVLTGGFQGTDTKGLGGIGFGNGAGGADNNACSSPAVLTTKMTACSAT